MINKKIVGDYKLINSKTGEIVFDAKDAVISFRIEDIENGTCENCGDIFVKTHGHQKFCPPHPGRKRSTCENTFNQRLKRQRMREMR